MNNKINLELGLSINLVGSGRLDTGYKGLNTNTNSDSINEYSKYITCSIYSSGVSIGLINYTIGFERAINELKEYKELDKQEYIKAWNVFRKEFGTHLITFVKMGGRLIDTIRIPTSIERSFNQHGFDLELAIETSLKFGDLQTTLDTSLQLKKSLDELKKSSSITSTSWGGIVNEDDLSRQDKFILKWKDSLHTNPMPIELTLEPISQLLPPILQSDYIEFISNYN